MDSNYPAGISAVVQDASFVNGHLKIEVVYQNGKCTSLSLLLLSQDEGQAFSMPLLGKCWKEGLSGAPLGCGRGLPASHPLPRRHLGNKEGSPPGLI
jgi:hypothetical protein